MTAQQASTAERVLCRVLYDATCALPQYRLRTRLSVLTESKRVLAQESGTAPSDDALMAELERMIAARLVDTGGPSQKRVRLNAAGKQHAAAVLKLKKS